MLAKSAKRTWMLTALLGILTCCILLSVTFRANAASSVKAYDESTDSHEPLRVDADSGELGQRVKVTEEFYAFGFNMPTWNTSDGAATLSVFKWDRDYDRTVAAEPLYSREFNRLLDNAFNNVRFKDTPLPAGEYLFLIHNAEGTVGCYSRSSNVSKGFCYQNGAEFSIDLELTISFSGNNIKDPFEQCQSVSELFEFIDPPKEYVIPADSLIYTHNVQPDTWVFTDALGREGLTYKDIGGVRDDKTIALFFWTWHNTGHRSSVPMNVQQTLEEHPEAIRDYTNPIWPSGGTAYFWDEPIYGYYLGTDEWVLRRQAELLANAGIDTIFTDNTNGTMTWRECYMVLYDTWAKAMEDGVLTPKVSFMLPFSPSESAEIQMKSLFQDIYAKKKYRQLWFYWDGKPMLMGWKGALKTSTDDIDANIAEFFTFRQNMPGYIYEESELGYEQWGWLSMYPQEIYYASAADKSAGKPEQITVGVAQNHNYRTHTLSAMNGPYNTGRSYTLDMAHMDELHASLYGYNFAEQFEYALSIDPKVIFVTGWNEWTAGRYEEWGGVENAFPDECNDENSRDIEPTRGELGDNYYYQLVNFVRRYKGVDPIPTPGDAKAITLDGGQDQWTDVAPYYAAYIGNTGDRDAIGYGSIKYQEFSGRNDIIGAQIARDNEFLYFHVECAEDITPYTDNLWMNLLIDCDAANSGWNTFDFVVNKSAASADTVVLERFTGDGYASEKAADCEYSVDGRYMTVKIRKADLGISGNEFTVNFAWTDNVHDVTDTGTRNADGSWTYTDYSGDIMEFYVSGDVAPGGRFKYCYDTTGVISTDIPPATADRGNSGSSSSADSGKIAAIIAVAVAAAAVVAAAVVLAVRKKK